MMMSLGNAAFGRLEQLLRRGGGVLPMNGQAARLEITREIFELCAIERIIETGAFRGATTAFLAQFEKPVVTIEISSRFAAYVDARLKALPNVEVLNANSVDGLKAIIAKRQWLEYTTFIYLDAHWYDYLPLKEELELIFGNFSRAIVMIDDFAVPDDPGYNFDDYGPGKALTMDYVSRARIGTPTFYLPAVRGQHETGSRRGTVVIAAEPELAERLGKAPLLRQWRG